MQKKIRFFFFMGQGRGFSSGKKKKKQALFNSFIFRGLMLTSLRAKKRIERVDSLMEVMAADKTLPTNDISQSKILMDLF